MQQISRSFSFRFIVSCLFFYLFKQPSAYFNRNSYNFANNFLDDDQGVSYPTWLRWTAWPGWMGEGRGGVGIFTLVMLVFDAGRRAISISMRGFLARAGEGAGEGAEEVEV